jgi:N-acetylmuramoyl-L-alanine amidase
MVIGIDLGHTLRGFNTGAEGIRKETDLNREVGFKVIEKLQKLGHEVINCTLDEAASNSESLAYRVRTANENNVDVFFSIHFNAGGGKGTECFAISSTGKEYAQKIVNEIAALGYVNRGVKDGSGLYVVKNTNAPACLIECCFVDSEEDMNRYNAETLAIAIVKGITGQEDIFKVEVFDAIGYMQNYRDLLEAYSNSHPDFIEFSKWHYDNYGKVEIAEGRR